MGQTEPKQIFADFCRFSPFPRKQSIWETQIFAENRWFSQKNAETRRKPQIAVCPLRFAPFSAALRKIAERIFHWAQGSTKGIWGRHFYFSYRPAPPGLLRTCKRSTLGRFFVSFWSISIGNDKNRPKTDRRPTQNRPKIGHHEDVDKVSTPKRSGGLWLI